MAEQAGPAWVWPLPQPQRLDTRDGGEAFQEEQGRECEGGGRWSEDTEALTGAWEDHLRREVFGRLQGGQVPVRQGLHQCLGWRFPKEDGS